MLNSSGLAVLVLITIQALCMAQDENLETLLDRSASNEARMRAGNLVLYIGPAGDLARLVELAKDQSQADELRALAITKVGENDPKQAVELALTLLSEKQNGGEKFRAITANYLTTEVEFGNAPEVKDYKQQVVEVLRQLLSMDEAEMVRQTSIAYLGKIGDPVGEEKLKEALMNPDAGIIDQERAAGYVAGYDARKYENELEFVLEFSDVPAAQAKAVEALASNPKFQSVIRRILVGKGAPLEVRLSAAEYLSRYLPETVGDVLRIADDESESAALRATCLYKVSGVVTQAEASPELWEKFGVSEDEVTTMIESIQSKAKSEQVKDAADSYIKAHKK